MFASSNAQANTIVHLFAVCDFSDPDQRGLGKAFILTTVVAAVFGSRRHGSQNDALSFFPKQSWLPRNPQRHVAPSRYARGRLSCLLISLRHRWFGKLFRQHPGQAGCGASGTTLALIR